MKYYPVRGLSLFREEEKEEVAVDCEELLSKGSSREARSDSSDDTVIDAGVGAGAGAGAGRVVEVEALVTNVLSLD